MVFQNMDKVRQNAHDACNRLGKYRMPFAWTAIWLQNIIKSKETLDRDSGGSDAESTASNSLDRKTSTASMEQFRNSRYFFFKYVCGLQLHTVLFGYNNGKVVST